MNANIKDRTGEQKMMRCGLVAKVTRYAKCSDIDIEFENGEKKRSSYSTFTKGQIAHPYLGIPGKLFFGFVTKKAFINDGNIYYLCKCTKCGSEDILTPHQMMEHNKKCNFLAVVE